MQDEGSIYYKSSPEEIILYNKHGEHIKKAGEHMVEVELAPEVKAEVKVVIKSE